MGIVNRSLQKEVWKSPPSIRCTRVEVSNLGRIRVLPRDRVNIPISES